MFCSLSILAAEEAGSLLSRLSLLLDQPHTGLILRSLILLVSGTVGIYLMLPRGQRPTQRFERYIGAGLATLALVLLVTVPVSEHPPVSTGEIPVQQSTVAESQEEILWSLVDQGKTASGTFFILAALSLASAVMMITSRNPVYSALWFAMVLLGNSGLYLLQGAEFLSASTIIVYAGAIVVTFLFVIMLAQPNGAAAYDRVSREPFLSSLTGLVLAATLVGALHHAGRYELRGGTTEVAVLPTAEVIDQLTALPDGRQRTDGAGHVEGLGRALFLDHVVSVQVIGLLLLVAVVGAMLIAGHRVEPAPVRPLPRK